MTAGDTLPLALDTAVLAQRLCSLPGIVETRLVRRHVWVVRSDTDVQRDEDIVGVLLDVLPADVEFHFAPAERVGMVPDGLRVL
jgi:hypothetical protein